MSKPTLHTIQSITSTLTISLCYVRLPRNLCGFSKGALSFLTLVYNLKLTFPRPSALTRNLPSTQPWPPHSSPALQVFRFLLGCFQSDKVLPYYKAPLSSETPRNLSALPTTHLLLRRPGHLLSHHLFTLLGFSFHIFIICVICMCLHGSVCMQIRVLQRPEMSYPPRAGVKMILSHLLCVLEIQP